MTDLITAIGDKVKPATPRASELLDELATLRQKINLLAEPFDANIRALEADRAQSLGDLPAQEEELVKRIKGLVNRVDHTVRGAGCSLMAVYSERRGIHNWDVLEHHLGERAPEFIKVTPVVTIRG